MMKNYEELHLIREDDEQLLEDSQEVDEQLQPMHDVVAVASAALLHDHLCVVHDEAAHHEEPDVQVGLGEEKIQKPTRNISVYPINKFSIKQKKRQEQ